jgi:hypothetical protein
MGIPYLGSALSQSSDPENLVCATALDASASAQAMNKSCLFISRSFLQAVQARLTETGPRRSVQVARLFAVIEAGFREEVVGAVGVLGEHEAQVVHEADPEARFSPAIRLKMNELCT